MNMHTQACCPRCQTRFTCNAGAIQACGCRQVDLTDAEARFIRTVAVQTNAAGCFCTRCLEDLKVEYRRQPQTTNHNV
ncbi:cysteine-rich CWC family protein [Spirosoma rigui]|uniref:cysteine-rich CWC family protein n=1 Tax=Spirosoma rigui TaxID=564064 RepID=UPI0009AF648C